MLSAAVEEFVVPFLTATGKTMGGGVVRGMLVTPAQVLGGVGLCPRPLPMGCRDSCWNWLKGEWRSRSLSLRKIWSKFRTRVPVAASSRTMGVPSMIETRRVVDSSRRTSSRKGA
jgi:hypothetical protein